MYKIKKKAASGQLRKNNHEDNQPLERYSDLIASSVGKAFPIKLDQVEMKNEGKYVGEWKDMMREGKGKHIWPDGSYYDGEWIQDKAHG